MQIRGLDGAMHQVAQSQVQKAYKMLPHHMTPKAQMQAQQDQMMALLQDMEKKACQYKDKASHNIKRIADLQHCPTTQDDVKTALVTVLRHGPYWAIADLMYQAVQFQAARFMKHILSKYTR